MTEKIWSPDLDFEFVPPPEAPIFRPTQEEFAKGPLHYINKIRSSAESFGICKIIPPSNFQPPFAVDVEKFRFTPRVQRLNELEAQTRVKLNFLEQIIKYWDLQGATLKIPTVEKKILDLYTLHKVVQEEGGFESCTRDRKWSRVAAKMGFLLTSHNKGTVASLLRQHYERILYPYDVFLSGATIGPDLCEDGDDECPQEIINHQEIVKQENLEENEERRRPLRRTRRMQGRLNNNKNKNSFQNKELKKLQVYGAGPKMPGILNNNNNNKEGNNLQQDAICIQCSEDQFENQLLKCAVCGGAYHCFCLIPPLNDVPKGVWHCARCVAYLVQTQPQPFTSEFGFVQSQRDYSLSEFGEMADTFKRNYFRMPPHSVPLSIVEKEFWRLVSSMEESVSVEYGADLQTNDYGSGFPTKKMGVEKEYVQHLWNLNNLPVLEGSVFKYINSDISGMIVPWMYVGMCFSTFCWHTEDHWSYSINYLHWGEPKSWYGVPGEHADTFERAMKRTAPELFNSQPDLLHQLVTICNPNVLMADGVPIYKTNQQAGEFVVTFPRSYHAGFNQGLNFAEAVNFAPADWLLLGRECMQHYSTLNRYPVFSHNELVCKMACDPHNLDISIASATLLDLQKMFQEEQSLRLDLLSWGVTKSQRFPFELLPDDERQCNVCRTTCFLSALTCSCSDKLVCIVHRDELCGTCDPEDVLLKYRYTLDELPGLVDGMKERKEDYEKWLIQVKDAFEQKLEERLPLNKFQEFLQVAQRKRFPLSCKVLAELIETVEEVEKSSKASRELLDRQKKMDEINNLKRVRQEFQETICSARLKNKKQEKTRIKQESNKHSTSTVTTNSTTSTTTTTTGNEADRLTLEELSLFHEEIENYPCEMKEAKEIKEILERCVSISTRIIEALKNWDQPISSSTVLAQIVEDAEGVAIVSFGKQLEKIKTKLEEVRWVEQVNELKKSKNKVKIEQVKHLLENGLNPLAGKQTLETFKELEQLLVEHERWMEMANALLQQQDSVSPVSAFKQCLEEAKRKFENLDLNPTVQKLEETIHKADDFQRKTDKLFLLTSQQQKPFLEEYEKLVQEASKVGCFLQQLTQLNQIVANAHNWKEKLQKLFLRKNSLFNSLGAILLPRVSFPPDSSTSLRLYFQQLKKKLKKDEKLKQTTHEQYRKMADFELTQLKSLRDFNCSNSNSVCFCEKSEISSLLIVRCQLCFNFFHQTCLQQHQQQTQQQQQQRGRKQQQQLQLQQQQQQTTEENILCLFCSRGRRPTVECAKQLLSSLQKLPVRIVEGELLDFLVNRTLEYQQKVRKELKENPLLSTTTTTTTTTSQQQQQNLEINKEKNKRKSPLVLKIESELKLDETARELLFELFWEGNVLELQTEEQTFLFNVFTHSTNHKTTFTTPNLTNQIQESISFLKNRKRQFSSLLENEISPPSTTTTKNNKKQKKLKKEQKAEICSIGEDKCLKPNGQEVNWVLCEGPCSSWFHQLCAGIKSPEDLNSIEKYFCLNCIQLNNNNTTTTTTTTNTN